MRRVIEAASSPFPPFSNPEPESQYLSSSSQVAKEDKVGRRATPSDQNLKRGNVTCGYLGVLIQDVTPAMAKAFKLDQARGALVGDVKDDGPAARAGLVRGDIIIELNGEEFTGKRELRLKISRMAPEAAVRLKIFRDGAEREVMLKLGELPAGEKCIGVGRESGSAPLGVYVQPLTPEIARLFDLPENTRGIFVNEIQDGSAAAEAELRSGDVIQEVDRQPVNNVAEFESAIKRAGNKPALLLVNRGGHTSYVVVGER